jgi:hypothetical protein
MKGIVLVLYYPAFFNSLLLCGFGLVAISAHLSLIPVSSHYRYWYLAAFDAIIWSGYFKLLKKLPVQVALNTSSLPRCYELL